MSCRVLCYRHEKYGTFCAALNRLLPFSPLVSLGRSPACHEYEKYLVSGVEAGAEKEQANKQASERVSERASEQASKPLVPTTTITDLDRPPDCSANPLLPLTLPSPLLITPEKVL